METASGMKMTHGGDRQLDGIEAVIETEKVSSTVTEKTKSLNYQRG
jgi:hypothetical protein